jgi:hypothetical protein
MEWGNEDTGWTVNPGYSMIIVDSASAADDVDCCTHGLHKPLMASLHPQCNADAPIVQEGQAPIVQEAPDPIEKAGQDPSES